MYNRKKKKYEQQKPHYKKEENEQPKQNVAHTNNNEGETNKPFTNKKKKKNFWRNRFKNKRVNKEKQSDFSDNQSKVRIENKQHPRYTQKPVTLPDDIMGLEQIEDSILKLQANTTGDEKTEIICPICNRPIKYLDSAIRHQPDGQPAHFECVIKEIVEKNREHLGRHKRVYYIGAGRFAVVREQYDKHGHVRTYQVLYRIPYEKQDNS